MVDRKERRRRPRDVGGLSPPEQEVQEQQASGARGGPQEARQPPRVQKQPPQTSGRRPLRRAHRPEEREAFSQEERPSAQGERHPSPERLKRRLAARDFKSRSGSHSAHGERTEEEAQRGAPRGGHSAWRGRQHVKKHTSRPDRSD